MFNELPLIKIRQIGTNIVKPWFVLVILVVVSINASIENNGTFTTLTGTNTTLSDTNTTLTGTNTTLTGTNTTLTGTNTTLTGTNTTHTGTEFVVMFTPYFNDTKFVQLIITSNGENDININIESPFPGTFQTTYKAHHVAIVDLPKSIVDLSDGSNANAVKITSDHPIFVVGLVGLGPYSTETFTAISSDKLGQSYFIATHINTVRYYGKDKMQTVGIASLQDNTDVTIYFSNTSDIFLQSSNQTISAGTNYTFSLGYLDTFYFETMDDITGTRIESTKPIAVFDGLKQVGITYDYKSKTRETNVNEIGMEQLPPTSTYSNEFIIPMIMHSAGIDAYIISPDPVYKIYTYTDDVYTVYQTENMHKASLSSKSPTSIASQSPLLLNIHVKMRYHMRTSYITVNIPGISQFSNEYVLATPFTNNTYENFVSVIIKSDDVNGLRFDDHPVAPVSESDINYENQMFKSLILRLSPIHSHIITHISNEVLFGVIVYGVGDGWAYGYPGGISL